MRPLLVVVGLASSVLSAAGAAAQTAEPAAPQVLVYTPPAAPTLSAPPSVGPAADRLVRIELPAMDRSARLEAFAPGRDDPDGDDDESWRTVCKSPCAASVPVGTRLRINGDFRVSPAFQAPDRAASRLTVDPARSWVRGVGIGVTISGAALTAIGVFMTAVGSAENEPKNDLGGTREDGIYTLVTGAVILGAGVTLAAVHWRTRVTLDGPAQPGVALGKGFWLTPRGVAFLGNP